MGVTKTDAYTAPQLELAEVCKALAHPARIAILEHLLSQECCICQDLTGVIDLSQPTLSRHLQVLRDAGIILGTAEGTSRSYCIHPAHWRRVQGMLHGFFERFGEGCC